MYIYIKSYIYFPLYLCFPFLSMALFLCYFVPPWEVSECIVCLCLYQFFCLTLHLPKKFDCDKVNLVLSVITITVVLVKLSQMIWGYINISLVCQSVSGFVSFFGRYAFLIIIVLFHKNFVLVRHRVPVVAGS